MVASKTTKPAKDGTGTQYTQSMVTESVGLSQAPVKYLADPVDESLVSPATSAKQPAIGVAGTPAADVLTVQGTSAMTPVKVSSADGGIAGIGSIGDSAWGGSGNANVIQALKAIYGASLGSIPTGANTIGAVTSANGGLVGIGSLADAAWSGTGNANVIQALKAIYGSTLGSIPAGSNTIGAVTGPAAAALALDSSVVTLNSSVTGNRPIANFFAPSVSESTTNPFSTDLQRNLRVTRQIFSGNATPTVTSNGAYSAGDVIGGKMSFAINLAARIMTLRVASQTPGITTNINAYIFNADPSASTFTNDAAPIINSADISKIVSYVTLTNPDSKLGNVTVWTANNIGMQFPYNAGSIWLVLVGISAFTLTTSSITDFTVRVLGEQ